MSMQFPKNKENVTIFNGKTVNKKQTIETIIESE